MVQHIIHMIYCELHSIFASPEGAGKNANNKQNAHLYHILEYPIKDLIRLFHYCAIFLVKVWFSHCYFATVFALL